jgi:hypothetical protein
VKSLIERPRPSPSIINAKQIGAILVTISTNYPSLTLTILVQL